MNGGDTVQKRSSFVHRRIVVPMLVLFPLLLSGCAEPLPAATATPPAKTEPATATPATALPTAPPSPSAEPAASPAPSGAFPMTAEEFEARFNDYIMMSWKPEKVLEYLEFDRPVPGLALSNDKLHIVSAGNGHVVVNEVLWVEDGDEPNGFRVEDPSLENRTCELAEDAGIWVLTGMYGYCRFSPDELASFVQSYDCEYTLWNYTVKDDRITVLAEQYIP